MLISFLQISCKKEVQNVQPKETSSKKTDLKISERINSFHARMKSKLKSNDYIPVDSAEWYLGAAINSQYGDASAKGWNISLDSAFVSLPIYNSQIPMENMSNLYEELVERITEHFYSIESNDRKLLAVVVKTLAQTADDTIDLKVTSIIMFDPFINDFWDFGENDYWKWWNLGGNNGGYCAGPYQGTATGSDAAIQIMRSVTFRKPIPSGYFCYIPPFENVNIYAYNWGNYMYGYYTSDPNFHICIPPDEMNQYLSGAEHICYTSNDSNPNPGARPPDLSFIELYLTGDILLTTPSFYLHRGTVYYGMLFETGNLPDNF